MKLLLTGVSSLTGRYIINHPLRPGNVEILGTSRRAHVHPDFKTLSSYLPLSFENMSEYEGLISRFRPDIIVHLGGEANVDSVEKNQQGSRISNFDFPMFLLEQATRVGAKIVQFSSNAVYDGNSAPYRETSLARPLNFYGRLKAEVDAATRKHAGDWLLLRPIVMYGWNYSFGRNNPISQFVPMLRNGKSIRMVTDQFENPIYAEDVAGIFWKCILNEVNGEFNLGGSDPCLSRYDWLRSVAEELGVNPELVQKASIQEFTLPAARPRDTRLDISRVIHDLAHTPVCVKNGLQLMLADSQKIETVVPAVKIAA